MSDKLRDKTHRLFEYISQVYSIDLPVVRDVTKYEAELWWQADIIRSSQCKIKEFSEGNINVELGPTDTIGEDAWLSVTKRSYDNPPELPSILKEWVILSPNPTKLPTTMPSILRSEGFESNPRRATAFKEYVSLFTEWHESRTGDKPLLPEVLAGWVDETQPIEQLPTFIGSREVEEKFEDDKNRVIALRTYFEGPWKIWSERVFPLFKANILYDQLFTLHQRLSVEGDRIEIIWGHLLLIWNHSHGNGIYHPLIITPMNLHFEPMRRNISLIPSQTVPTKMDLEFLTNLDYPLKDELIRYTRVVNNSDTPPEAWDHSQMRGIAATFTGYISKESAEKTNQYSEKPIARPSYSAHPTIHNAPLIFVRERTRRLWIEDAKKVAEAVYNGAEIPPFIRSLTADPRTNELPNPEDYVDDVRIDDDDGENLLPLLYNDPSVSIVTIAHAKLTLHDILADIE